MTEYYRDENCTIQLDDGNQFYQAIRYGHQSGDMGIEGQGVIYPELLQKCRALQREDGKVTLIAEFTRSGKDRSIRAHFNPQEDIETIIGEALSRNTEVPESFNTLDFKK
jgi:hypothetical protein